MEFTKDLPSEFSAEENLEADIKDYILSLKASNDVEGSMGLTSFQIKGLADASKRTTIIEDLRKKGRLSLPMVTNSEKATFSPVRHLNGPRVFNIPAEDIRNSSEKFEILRLSALLNCLLGITSFGCSAILYDIEYSQNSFGTNHEIWLHLSVFNSVTNLILFFAILLNKECELEWEISKSFFPDSSTIYTSGKLKPLIFELLCNLIHPLWFLQGKTVQYYSSVLQVTVNYSINSILSAVSIVKIIHLIKYFLLSSQFFTPRAQRVCKMNGVKANKAWTLKCLMIVNPFQVVSGMLLGGILIGGYCLRIFERPLDTPGDQFGYDEYANGMWIIMITMTTVGFGDFYLYSIAGRLIGVVSCIWGVFVVSLMVVGVTNVLSFDPGQSKSFTLHQRLKFKDYFRSLAASLVGSAYRFSKIMKSPDASEKIISIRRSKHKRNIIHFQRAKYQSDVLYETNTSERKIERKINQILESAEKDTTEIQKIYEKLMKFKNLE